MDLLVATLRSLRAHALRFALTASGIVWGAFMLTYLSATTQGTDRHFMRVLEKAGPKIVNMGGGAVLKARVGERGARQVELEDEDAERVASIAMVEGATPMIDLYSEIVRAGRRTKLVHVQGVGADGPRIRNFSAAQGRSFTPLEVERGARVALLGAEASERLFGRRPALGQRLQIGGTTFRVVGIAERKGPQLVNSLNPDDRAILVPYTAAQRWITRSDVLPELAFAPHRKEDSAAAIRRVRETLAPHHDFHPDSETALWFFDIQEVLALVHGMGVALQVFLVVAGLTTLLVGAVGVMNIMLVVVSERTHEIGLRKAVGAGSRAIFVQFVAEAAAVCLLSGALGTALGVGTAQLVARMLPPDSPFASVPVLDPVTVLAVTSGLVLVGIVAGVAPALRAARVPPAEALRAL